MKTASRPENVGNPWVNKWRIKQKQSKTYDCASYNKTEPQWAAHKLFEHATSSADVIVLNGMEVWLYMSSDALVL
jgi:hypothetical protein